MHTTTHTPERERVPWVGRTGHSKKERAARAPAAGSRDTNKRRDRPTLPHGTRAPPPHAVSQLQLPSDCPTQFCNGKIRGGHTCSAPADLHEATCHMISQARTSSHSTVHTSCTAVYGLHSRSVYGKRNDSSHCVHASCCPNRQPNFPRARIIREALFSSCGARACMNMVLQLDTVVHLYVYLPPPTLQLYSLGGGCYRVPALGLAISARETTNHHLI